MENLLFMQSGAHVMPDLVLPRSRQTGAVPPLSRGPRMGHTARPEQARRGRARKRRPQLSPRAGAGRCGSQADHVGPEGDSAVTGCSHGYYRHPT